MLAVFASLCARIAVAAALLAIAACGGLPDRPASLSPDEVAQLQKRVHERWLTLERKDFGAAWEYSTPAYRASFPKRLFVQNFSYAVDRQLTAVEAVNYDAEAAVASVAVRVMSKPTKQTAISAQFGALPTTVRERWILSGGEWWHSANN